MIEPPAAVTRPALQQWAGFYRRSLGWAPVPLNPGTKECSIKGWPAIDFRPEDFHTDQNIGLKSQHGLVLFDNDCAKRGLQIRRAFLPETPARYGRDSAKDAKALYLCPELVRTHTWKDLRNDHLVQLRVGQQDMVPPSVHPSGERLVWNQRLYHDMLSPTPAEALITGCNLRSTAALIALHWPSHGRRELLLAYARVLLETLGLDDAVAEQVLLLACELGNFDREGLDKARRAISSTRLTLEQDEPALGAVHIRKAIPEGAALLRRLREWFGKTNAVEEAIERLNDRVAIVSVGNKVVVMETWSDGGIKELWPFEEFRRLLIKDRLSIDSTTKVKGLADVWLTHRTGRQYARLVYDMPGSVVRCEPSDYNAYLGFTVTPAPGDWSNNRDHLLRIICSGDRKSYDWLFNWCAAFVQQPGRHAMTAVVLRGGKVPAKVNSRI